MELTFDICSVIVVLVRCILMRKAEVIMNFTTVTFHWHKDLNLFTSYLRDL